MRQMDAKSIVLICNGPSIANVDWSRLDDFNTMGLNGSFKLWNDIKWYPTYQYMARKHEKQWKEGLDEFMKTNCCSKIFYNTEQYPEFSAWGVQVCPINFTVCPSVTPDPDRWENPFMHDVGIALGMISKVKGFEFAQKKVNEMPEDIDNNLNVYGIYKVLMGLEKNIRETDYVTKERYIPEMTVPESFDNFQYESGMAAEIACWICRILGFNRIVLIGCDNNFVINKDGTMRQKASYGVKDMFYGKKYNTKEDIVCPACRTTEGLRHAMRQRWHKVAMMIKMWNLDLEIINCAPEDNIGGMFPHLDPKDVLGVDIYKH